MSGAYGEYLFGQVDHVPGRFYVSTKFLHFNFVPLIPVRGYLVRDGSDNGTVFQGVRIPLSLKSVLAGYLRGWLGVAAIFTGGVAAFAAAAFYVGVKYLDVVAGLAAMAAMVAVLWFIFSTRTWWFLPVQLALLLASAAVYHDVRARVPDAAFVPGSPDRRRDNAAYINLLLVANAAALLFTLTRLLTPASRRRALALERRAGIPPEQFPLCCSLPYSLELDRTAFLPPKR
jgi:hypothetical protein